MNAKDAYYCGNFDGDLRDDSHIECPECLEAPPLSEWREAVLGCDLCGEHAAVSCPSCCEVFDSVNGPDIKVLN